MTFHVEVALANQGELFVEGSDLEGILEDIKDHVTQTGFFIHLDPVVEDVDADDGEPATIKWNPFQEFEHSIS